MATVTPAPRSVHASGVDVDRVVRGNLTWAYQAMPANARKVLRIPENTVSRTATTPQVDEKIPPDLHAQALGVGGANQA